MMDYEPITQELRKDFDLCTRMDGIAPNEFETVWITKSVAVAALDNIDAIHRSLEKENECLHERLQELDNADSSMQIGEVTVTITPRIDWTAIADDLRDAAKALCERTREGEE